MFYKPLDKEASFWFTHSIQILNPGVQALLNLSPLLGGIRVGVNVAMVTRRQGSTQCRGCQNCKKLGQKLELNSVYRLGVFPPKPEYKQPSGTKRCRHRHPATVRPCTRTLNKFSTEFHRFSELCRGSTFHSYPR